MRKKMEKIALPHAFSAWGWLVTPSRSSRDQGGAAILWDRDWVRTSFEASIDHVRSVALHLSRARITEK